eukprot:TRINITY_DN38129_c0_g1_i1.p1 TRINITY_DN38129_c0_g1~~TRINITY_DN38129_c0_g1_i1.p1  ORF type:complete len:145 (-),score=36.96 TRINITY_DN38129_c0_g1_i1:292-726(-)
MSRNGSLWIGGLEEYMDEDFILKCLNAMGETYSGVISIKVVKNKFTGQHAGYGFINFVNDNFALTAMHKLNGKIMPNTNPRSGSSSTTTPRRREERMTIIPSGWETSVRRWMTTNVQILLGQVPSVKSARVMLDENGYSKGLEL